MHAELDAKNMPIARPQLDMHGREETWDAGVGGMVREKAWSCRRAFHVFDLIALYFTLSDQ